MHRGRRAMTATQNRPGTYFSVRPASESCPVRGLIAPPGPHEHRPGTVVHLDAGDLRSTCTGCGQPIAQLYLDQDEDRVPGWGPWKLAPVTVP